MKFSDAGQIIGCLPVDLDPAGCTLDTSGIITHFGDPTLTKNSLSLERINAIHMVEYRSLSVAGQKNHAHVST